MSSTYKKQFPVVVVLLAAAVWGLFWIPLRAFESNGLSPIWTTLAQFVVPLLVLLPIALIRVFRGLPTGINQVLTGVLVALAFSLYYNSLLLTDVVRSLILFYITPAWSTLLEVLIMKRRIRIWRFLALISGFSGLIVILGVEGQIPVPRNLGDTMALCAGVVWAIGSMRVRLADDVSTFEQIFSFFFYGSLVSILFLFLPIAELGTAPSLDVFFHLWPWMLLMTVTLLIPMMWGLLWGSQLIDPGRLGILLQMEAIVGIGSAAVLTNEPFGIREILGTALVVSAGLLDVLGQRSRKTHRAEVTF